jgi:hypothetical protein
LISVDLQTETVKVGDVEHLRSLWQPLANLFNDRFFRNLGGSVMAIHVNMIAATLALTDFNVCNADGALR